MLRQQLDIFYDVIHDTERLPDNQNILDEYRKELGQSAMKAYNYLMSGNEGTVHDMKVDRSRMSELTKPIKEGGAGFKFSYKMNGRFKVWYCTPEDKAHNEKRMNELKNKNSK